MSNYGLVFLDIDGVLHTPASIHTGLFAADPACVEILNVILDRHSEARIIVSSTWRLTRTPEQIAEILSRYSFRHADRMREATTGETTFNGKLYISRSREEEIVDFLFTEPRPRPAWYVVIDDERIQRFGQYQIVTRFELGLQPEHVAAFDEIVAWQIGVVR